MKNILVSTLLLLFFAATTTAQEIIISKLWPHLLSTSTNSVEVIFPSEPWPDKPYVKMALLEVNGISSIGESISSMQKTAGKLGYDAIKLLGTEWGILPGNSIPQANMPVAVAIKYVENANGTVLAGYKIETFDNVLNIGETGNVRFDHSGKISTNDFFEEYWRLIQQYSLCEWERCAEKMKVEYSHSKVCRQRFQIGQLKLKLEFEKSEKLTSGDIRTVNLKLAELAFASSPQQKESVQTIRISDTREKLLFTYRWGEIGELQEFTVRKDGEETPLFKVIPIYSNLGIGSH